MNFEDITPDYLYQQGINPDGLLFSRYHLPYNPKLREFSRDMRRDGEKAEAMLWKRLKAKQLGFTFNRQKPILNFIADFYCKELNLVVEIDGASHFSAEAQQRDKEREEIDRCRRWDWKSCECWMVMCVKMQIGWLVSLRNSAGGFKRE